MISKVEYSIRRRELMNLMGANSIAILPAAREKIRSNDTHYAFRQDSDLFYLTGYTEPGAVLVLLPDREHGEYILFCREGMANRHSSLPGPAAVKKQYRCDDVFPIDDLEDILPGLMEGRTQIYYDFGNDPELDKDIFSWNNSDQLLDKKRGHPPSDIISLSHFVHDMRLIKSKSEIDIIREAVQISAAAHRTVMQLCRPRMTEQRIEAELVYQMSKYGARHMAYPFTVAGGGRACIFHYTENSGTLTDGELLLIDAGAELHNYASDVSRTFPVNGTFSAEQREVYRWVLKANIAAVDAAVAGNAWSALHDAAVQVITEGLVAMGILQGEVEDLIDAEAHLPYYPYKTGHWIGLDVHDVGDYEQDEDPVSLAEGMVLTVEPGLYFKSNTKHLDEKWWGIGVRIEDVVLITATSNNVLSSDAPKEIAEIEAVMASGMTTAAN